MERRAPPRTWKPESSARDGEPFTPAIQRNGFLASVDDALAHARRHGHKIAVLAIDLSGLSDVETKLGALAAAEAWAEIMHRVGKCSRREDTYTRVGDHDLAVLVSPLPSVDTGSKLALRLTQAMAKRIWVAESGVVITASVGIATGPWKNETGEILLVGARHACAAPAPARVR